MSYTHIFILESYDNQLSYTNKALMFEFHEQDLNSNPTVTTKLDVIFGALPLSLSGSGAETAYTNGTINNTNKTVTVNGTAKKFFLVGRCLPKEG